MRSMMIPLVAVGLLLGSAGSAHAEAGKYQLMKATDDRVWRLNTETGEITVCTLAGERLTCTHSSDALTPPKTSWQAAEAARKAAAEEAKREEERQRKQEMAIVDRIFQFFREIMDMTRKQEG